MAQRPRKRSAQSGFSGNHQRSWLWGRHAVTETLQAAVWPIVELYVSQAAADEFSRLIDAKREAGVPVQIVDSSRLEQLSRSTEHQGLVARLGPFRYRTLDTLIQLLAHQPSNAAPVVREATNAVVRDILPGLPLVVICDRIQDTFNFGAILRCCDGANVTAVVVGEQAQAEVTPHVARSSSGAVNHVPIVQVADTLAAVQQIKACGLQLVAADSNTSTNLWHTPLAAPTALVIGSEAQGIRPDLLSLCNQRVSIPMQGRVTSLNAAVAAGILLYEIRRQQTDACR